MAAPFLSAEQLAACDRIDEWLDDDRPSPVFRVDGYAGTGKTTIAVDFANLPGAAAVCYQGKATTVLRAKGANRVSTAHAYLYGAPKVVLAGGGGEELQWLLREKVEPRDLIVIDESSMIGGDLGRDLLVQSPRILAFGDSFQLPAIDEDGAFFTRSRFPIDIQVTEVHRQALDSPVLKMATEIRLGMPMPEKGHQYDLDEMLDADIVITALRESRRGLNFHLRRRKIGNRYMNHPPIPGERIICLRTDYPNKIYNGTIWQVQRVKELPDEILLLDLFDEAEAFVRVRAPKVTFNAPAEFDVHTIPRDLTLFDFAYAVTCHKAQGSEWPNVAVLDETRNPGFAKMCPEWMRLSEFRRKWLYTAVTRARKRIEIFRH